MLKKLVVAAQLALLSALVHAVAPPETIPQTITGFAPATPLNYSAGLSFGLSATGGASGNPVTFSSATPSICSVSGSTASVLAPGACTIDANQASKQVSTILYSAAAQVTATVVINQVAPSASDNHKPWLPDRRFFKKQPPIVGNPLP